MTDSEIKQLAEKYRKAIESAHKKGLFVNELGFENFPRGSCGETCYLLAEYLRRFEIDTIWYSAARDDWSHAWLIVKDSRVKKPTPKFYEAPEDIHDILNLYSGGQFSEPIDGTRYEETHLQDGLIIDITGDQFQDYNCPVYVGNGDPFHQSFNFRQAHDYEGLNDERLYSLYETIIIEMKKMEDEMISHNHT